MIPEVLHEPGSQAPGRAIKSSVGASSRVQRGAAVGGAWMPFASSRAARGKSTTKRSNPRDRASACLVEPAPRGVFASGEAVRLIG